MDGCRRIAVTLWKVPSCFRACHDNHRLLFPLLLSLDSRDRNQLARVRACNVCNGDPQDHPGACRLQPHYWYLDDGILCRQQTTWHVQWHIWRIDSAQLACKLINRNAKYSATMLWNCPFAFDPSFAVFGFGFPWCSSWCRRFHSPVYRS